MRMRLNYPKKGVIRLFADTTFTELRNLHFLVSWKAIVHMGYACGRLQFTHQPRGLIRILHLCILSVYFQFLMMNLR